MELFIFIVFQLLVNIQSSEFPRVKVSPGVLRESDSVQLICETPADASVNRCYFYSKTQTDIKVSQSCQHHLTGAELLGKTGEKSPVSLNIYCYYTSHKINKPSSPSPPASVTVLDFTALQKPTISVEDSTALLIISCEIPLTVRADFTCNIYNKDGAQIYSSYAQRRQSEGHFCVFHLSHSELLTETVNSRQLSCDYSLNTEPAERSPHSDIYTIKGPSQAKLTVSASVIQEKDTVQLNCENLENQKMEMCYFIINEEESNMKQSKSCQLSLTGSDIIIWSRRQSSSVNINCYYTVNKSQVQVPSPHSDLISVTIQSSIPTTTQHVTTTELKTYFYPKSTLPVSTKKETMILTTISTHITVMASSTYTHLMTNPLTSTKKETILPSTYTHKVSTMAANTSVSQITSTSVPDHKDLHSTTNFPTDMNRKRTSVFLSVLLSICLCRFVSKQLNLTSQRFAGAVHGSEPAETYTLITSVPALSQPSGTAETYSLTSSINSNVQSSDAVVNKQHKEESIEEKKNVYHLYCTIPDKPVNSSEGDQIYSLVKMH